MKFFRWILSVAIPIAIGLILMFASTGGAQALMLKMSLQELAVGADSIVIGTVVSTSSHWNADHSSIYTEVVISVEDNLKGDGGKETITIIVDGGTVGEITQWVSDTPAFEVGEEVCLFLQETKTAELAQVSSGAAPQRLAAALPSTVYGRFQGKLSVRDNKVKDLPLATFKQQLSQAMQQKALPATSAESTLVSGELPYALTGQYWPHPPNPVVDYTVNANCADVGTELAAVKAAANSWTNAGAKFSYHYDGTNAKTARDQNSINEIMWTNRDLGGALGLSSWWYNPATNEIVESDVEFDKNDYTWCVGAQPGKVDIESVAVHELGHSLGMDHSDPLTAPVMYSTYTMGTTKQTLATDDKNGIIAIYGAAGTIPAKPTILYPRIPGGQVLLRWKAVTGATKYHLQVNTKQDFTGTFYCNSKTITTAYKTVYGCPNDGTLLYYRLRAGNGSGWSAWSAVERFQSGSP